MKNLNKVLESFFQNTGSGVFSQLKDVCKCINSNYEIINNSIHIKDSTVRITGLNFEIPKDVIVLPDKEYDLMISQCDINDIDIFISNNIRYIEITKCRNIKTIKECYPYGLKVKWCDSLKDVSKVIIKDEYGSILMNNCPKLINIPKIESKRIKSLDLLNTGIRDLSQYKNISIGQVEIVSDYGEIFKILPKNVCSMFLRSHSKNIQWDNKIINIGTGSNKNADWYLDIKFIMCDINPMDIFSTLNFSKKFRDIGFVETKQGLIKNGTGTEINRR